MVVLLMANCKNEIINQPEIINTAQNQIEMGKNITIPEDYNPIKNQCGTLTLISGNFYDGSVITIMQVKNALGESTTSLGALCNSPLINKWAAFKSGYFTTSGSPVNTYIFNPSINGFRLGDFIGYNHSAKPPVYYSNTLPSSISVEEWGYIDFYVELARGEAHPVLQTAEKTAVDIQTTYNAVTLNNRVSVPAVGSSYSHHVYLQAMVTGNLLINPTYYREVNTNVFQDLGIIEDMGKTVSIIKTAVLISGSISDVADKTTVSTTTTIAPIWILNRTTASTKIIYARIKITGTNINTSVYDLGQLTFSASETKTATPTITVVKTSVGDAVVNLSLEISRTADFYASDVKVLSQSSLNWSALQ